MGRSWGMLMVHTRLTEDQGAHRGAARAWDIGLTQDEDLLNRVTANMGMYGGKQSADLNVSCLMTTGALGRDRSRIRYANHAYQPSPHRDEHSWPSAKSIYCIEQSHGRSRSEKD